MCGDVIGQECQRLPAPNLPSNASIGLDNRYFFLFFYLSSYFSFHLYFIYFLLLPLSSHLLLMSILVFLRLSANTYGVQHLLSSTLTAIHAVKDRYSSVPQDNICQYSRQHFEKYECFTAVSSGITCCFSVCSEDSEHTANHSTSQ